jgi:hypothetical protein
LHQERGNLHRKRDNSAPKLQHSVQISDTFCHLLPHVFAQFGLVSCQEKPAEIPKKRASKPEIVHNAPQLPTNANETGQSPAIRGKTRKSATTHHKCQQSPKKTGELSKIVRPLFAQP